MPPGRPVVAHSSRVSSLAENHLVQTGSGIKRWFIMSSTFLSQCTHVSLEGELGCSHQKQQQV